MIFQYVLLFGVIFCFVFIILLIYHYYLLKESVLIITETLENQNKINKNQNIVNDTLIKTDKEIIDILLKKTEEMDIEINVSIPIPEKKKKLSIYSSPIINND